MGLMDPISTRAHSTSLIGKGFGELLKCLFKSFHQMKTCLKSTAKSFRVINKETHALLVVYRGIFKTISNIYGGTFYGNRE